MWKILQIIRRLPRLAITAFKQSVVRRHHSCSTVLSINEHTLRCLKSHSSVGIWWTIARSWKTFRAKCYYVTHVALFFSRMLLRLSLKIFLINFLIKTHRKPCVCKHLNYETMFTLLAFGRSSSESLSFILTVQFDGSRKNGSKRK